MSKINNRIELILQERKQEVIEKAKEALERNENVVRKARLYVEEQKNKITYH